MNKYKVGDVFIRIDRGGVYVITRSKGYKGVILFLGEILGNGRVGDLPIFESMLHSGNYKKVEV